MDPCNFSYFSPQFYSTPNQLSRFGNGNVLTDSKNHSINSIKCSCGSETTNYCYCSNQSMNSSGFISAGSDFFSMTQHPSMLGSSLSGFMQNTNSLTNSKICSCAGAGCTYCSNLLENNENLPANSSSLFLDDAPTAKKMKMTTNETKPNLNAVSYVEPFCTVPGRLSLLTSIKKYRVTVGEIHRRVSPPECLNVSIIGGILRKAKSRSGGQTLRVALNDRGINIQSGRRKTVSNTLFTALVEEEAVHLANDYEELCQSHFPRKEMAKFILNTNNVNSQAEANNEKIFLSRFNDYLNRAILFLQSDRTPLADQIQHSSMQLDSESQRALTNFSLLTHGFGNKAAQAVLKTFQHCINECSQMVD